MVFVQLCVVSLVGYGIGAGGAALTGLFAKGTGLAFQMPWQVPVAGFLAILACAALAGAVALWRVLRVDPALVFKS
jgi:putative ABC transport system permease protein